MSFALKCLFISAAFLTGASNVAQVQAAGPSVACYLGTAAPYAALLGAAFTNSANTGTQVNGNVGLVGGSTAGGIGALTGFTMSIPAGTGIITGTLYRDSPLVGTLAASTNGVAGVAWLSALKQFNSLMSLAPTAELSAATLVGATLTPGIYHFGTSLTTPANMVITLNGAGVYIFQINGALTTGANNAITFLNLAKNTCVYWVVRDAITFGAGSNWVGNVLVGAAINAGAGSKFTGLMWTKLGAATVDSSTWTPFSTTASANQCTSCNNYSAKVEGDSTATDALAVASDASTVATASMMTVAVAAAVVNMMQ